MFSQAYHFFKNLFNTDGFPPRWHCGKWTSFHGWLYIISDLLIWSAYFLIPLVILRYIIRKTNLRFTRLYLLFAAFILACGATHLLDAIIFWYPYYRLSAVLKFITGILSWVTVFYLVKYLPFAFSLKTSAQLEEEIELRKTVEHQLQESNEKLHQAEMELKEDLQKEKELSTLKSRFVSFASHEFRTPLSSVLTPAYLLSQYTKAEQQEQREKHIQRIVSSVSLLKETLNDFLSLDKIEQGAITPNCAHLDICELTNEVVQGTEHMLKNGQTITYVHNGETTAAFLDPSMLRHILSNLVSNAIKYSPAQSEISIVTERNAGVLKASVTDKGIGIPAEEQDNLFRLFFRSSNALHLQGTGLGLNIVKRYVELMNGKISFNSRQNEGTTFTLYFDMQMPAAQR